MHSARSPRDLQIPFLLMILIGLAACAPSAPAVPTRQNAPTVIPIPSLAPTAVDTATATRMPTSPASPTAAQTPTSHPSPSPTVAAATATRPSSPTSADSGDPVLVAAGDIACDPANATFRDGKGTATSCHMAQVADLILRLKPSAVLQLGDFQYFCGSFAATMKSYDPTWGRFKDITFPAVGNHEYLTTGEEGASTGCDATNAGAAGYFRYFGTRAGKPGSGYYSFDLGAWHLIALNSNCNDAGGCGSGSPQESWLRDDLASHPNKCTLAFYHIPLWSSGGRSNNNSLTLVKDLYEHNADLILTGHDHDYERFAPQDPSGKLDLARGIREFVVGTGGANHTPIVKTLPNSEVRDDKTYGVLQVTLHPMNYDWQFVPEPGATFTDSGTQACH